MTRSVVEILISTVRAQAEAVLAFEQMRVAGVDEFTTARTRRALLDGAREAQSIADMAEATLRRARASMPHVQSLPVANTDQPEPPSEPPPQAA
ncbi:hypothetical protein D3C71_346920 [compost metagenome]|jgi:hypothetical protein